MKKITVLTACAALAGLLVAAPSASMAAQTLPWTDHFAYTPGFLVPNGGWTESGSNSATSVPVTAGSLAYAGSAHPHRWQNRGAQRRRL